MAANPELVTPDLAAILATLSESASSYNQLPHNSQPADQQRPQWPTTREIDVLDHPQIISDPSRTQRPTPSSAVSSSGPVIDPASITEWSAGLRCVSKMAAQNSNFSVTIRRLIDDQRKHEMQWFASRQTLKRNQASRGTGAERLRSIMQSVGGTQSTSNALPQSEEEKQAELITYDRSVYKAQAAMAQSMSGELKALGVPFFGTKEDAVLRPDEDGTSDDSKTVRPKWSPRVNHSELLDLQRRMISYLEDMYKD